MTTTEQLNGAPRLIADGLGALLWIIAFSLMLQPLATDFYLASLPAIGVAFSASPSQLQDTLTFFALGFGVAQLAVGPLTDYFGRRPALLVGVLLFAGASGVCAIADSMAMLVAGRVVEAVGCCTAVVVARSIIRDAFTLAEGAHVMARASTILSLGPLFGPILAGYLQTWFGWPAVFVALALFSAILLALVWVHLPETLPGQNGDALRPSYVLTGYAEIARAPMFWAYALPGALSYASLFVFLSGSAQVLISVLKLPPHYFGYCFSLAVCGYLGGTMVCQRLIVRRGVEAALRVGAWLALGSGLGFGALVALGLHHWSTVVLAQFMVMFAHGINMPCAQAGSTRPFPARAGAASGLSGCVMMVCAMAAGLVVAASFDGSMVPMSMCSVALGSAIFVLNRVWPPRRQA